MPKSKNAKHKQTAKPYPASKKGNASKEKDVSESAERESITSHCDKSSQLPNIKKCLICEEIIKDENDMTEVTRLYSVKENVRVGFTENVHVRIE